MDQSQLTTLFAKLGARNPPSWAKSQIEEGIPQLARFLFLRQAWRLVLDEHDYDWVRQQMDSNPKASGGGIGPALRRLRALGAGDGDLNLAVRVMQWQLLSGLCRLLDDPGDLEEDVKGVTWKLAQIGEDGNVVAYINGLHESVLETDPVVKCDRTNETGN